MPSLTLTPKQQAIEKARPDIVGVNLPSMPADGYDYTVKEEPSHESIFHPVKAVEDILDAIRCLESTMRLVVQKLDRMHSFVETPMGLGATIGYDVDYHGHLFISVYNKSQSAAVLEYSTGGSASVPQNQWTHISPPKGCTITLSGGSDILPTPFVFRASDYPYTS